METKHDCRVVSRVLLTVTGFRGRIRFEQTQDYFVNGEDGRDGNFRQKHSLFQIRGNNSSVRCTQNATLMCIFPREYLNWPVVKVSQSQQDCK